MTHEHQRGRLMTADAAAGYALAGNATLTLVSAKTGARFTYSITGKADSKDQGFFNIWFIALLRGPDSESDYNFLGFIRPQGLQFIHGRKSKIAPDAPSARAFEYFWRNMKANRMPEQLECWHEGKCGRCGRKLTVPDSVARGIGPECATKLGA